MRQYGPRQYATTSSFFGSSKEIRDYHRPLNAKAAS